MPRPSKPKSPKTIATIRHGDDKRKNIPTAEYQTMLRPQSTSPLQAAYERRNRDLDPQLVWRGKDIADSADLLVNAPPLYIQEKIQPKTLIDDLLRHTRDNAPQTPNAGLAFDFYNDFNGLPPDADRTAFYQYDQNWSNRMILGDSLQVMASLAEREGLRNKVQCIYFDPPYGIKFNSNFQWSTTSRDVKDGKTEHITREPEQVKAFRDTWRDGIHSYLSYLRDRLTVARDLLADSGSIFVQIGDENVHRVRAVMDEVFGDDNIVSQIAFKTTTGRANELLAASSNYLIWAARDISKCKYRALFQDKSVGSSTEQVYSLVRDTDGTSRRISKGEKTDMSTLPEGTRVFRPDNLTSSRPVGESDVQRFDYRGQMYTPGKGTFKTELTGLTRLGKADRLWPTSQGTVQYVRFLDDFPVIPFSNVWTDTGTGSFTEDKVYVVQTNTKVIERCILMTTDPGDLVLDPTCGSGTTAYVAEQWGRRWITIDTSRVALALARGRIMGARYPYYLLADSRDGQLKEAELTRKLPSEQPTYGNIRHGFVYERVPHITLKSIANNAEIDVIWEQFEQKLKPLREQLSAAIGRKTTLEEWEIPREKPANWPPSTQPLITSFWRERISRQKEVDKSIAAKADYEYLYDKPCDDKRKVRVAGPFTVESLSPHRVLGVDENDDLLDPHVLAEKAGTYTGIKSFPEMVLENLKTAGVQQAHKEDRITFTTLRPWPGRYVCAEGFYMEGETTRRAGILIGPEFGTVDRPALVDAARECAESGFDVLISCAFHYDVHTTEFTSLAAIPVLKARMNADLHMAADLKNTGKGNLFVIFGEPDIEVASEEWIVDSAGTKIAPYEIFKIVSGLDSLEKIQGLDRDNLQAHARISCRREIWDYLANAAGGLLDSGKHRGGAVAQYDGGVSTVAWHGARLARGTGDICHHLRGLGIPKSGEFRTLVEQLRRDKQNAHRPDSLTKIPATTHSSLTTPHSPLPTIHSPLATCHFAQAKVKGVDVFKPQLGKVESSNTDEIACWFIDTDYNNESFFVRHAYFLGANDPYTALKTTLKAEIASEAWETLHSDTSRPFPRPKTHRIAVKVINHLGDEVMKVFKV